MTQTEHVVLEKVMVHRVGNPTRGEGLSLSAMPLTLNDALLHSMLVRYFVHWADTNELYQFTHVSSVELNEVYAWVQALFANPAQLSALSANIARFLHSKSTHARVKEGELYVGLLRNVPFENDFVDAVAIFKSETKQPFLKVFAHGHNIEMTAEEGVHVNKPDKGCLIFRTQQADGYRLCITDITNKQQDALYWVQDFLQVRPVANEYHHTRGFLQLCKDFATGEMPEHFDVNKQDQIEMMQRSMDYFKTKEQFDYQEFTQEVIHHPEVVEQFDRFKNQYEQAHHVALEAQFEIDTAAVKKQQRVFKSVLKLDKNFHIYIHGRRDLLERGFDEEKGKHYYKVYFEEEA
jgi:hypothetical protein